MSDASIPSSSWQMPRVLVTRPAREAQAWVEALHSWGVDAHALPLIDILPVVNPQPLLQAWSRVADYHAVMFVSANAVTGFFAVRGSHPLPWRDAAARPRAWATGPGTRQALTHAGVPASCIDAPDDNAAQFDSESLWRKVAGQVATGGRVLLVRGGDEHGQPTGRDWLHARMARLRVQVDTVVAYRRSLPVWTPQDQALAQASAADGTVWLFSSSEAVRNLPALMPGQDWHRARALAIHPRIAEVAQSVGFAVVKASRPGVADIVASIKLVQ